MLRLFRKDDCRDSGDAVLVVSIVSMPLLALLLAFTSAVATWIGNKDNVDSMAQSAAHVSVKTVDKYGSLTPYSAVSFAREYNRLFDEDVFSLGKYECTSVGGENRIAKGYSYNSIFEDSLASETENNSIAVRLSTARDKKGREVIGPWVFQGNRLVRDVKMSTRDKAYLLKRIEAEVVTAMPNPFTFAIGMGLPDCINMRSQVSAIAYGSQEDVRDARIIDERKLAHLNASLVPKKVDYSFDNCRADGTGFAKTLTIPGSTGWNIQLVKNNSGNQANVFMKDGSKFIKGDKSARLTISVPEKIYFTEADEKAGATPPYPTHNFKSFLSYKLVSSSSGDAVSSEIRTIPINYCAPTRVNEPEPAPDYPLPIRDGHRQTMCFYQNQDNDPANSGSSLGGKSIDDLRAYYLKLDETHWKLKSVNGIGVKSYCNEQGCRYVYLPRTNVPGASNQHNPLLNSYKMRYDRGRGALVVTRNDSRWTDEIDPNDFDREPIIGFDLEFYNSLDKNKTRTVRFYMYTLPIDNFPEYHVKSFLEIGGPCLPKLIDKKPEVQTSYYRLDYSSSDRHFAFRHANSRFVEVNGVKVTPNKTVTVYKNSKDDFLQYHYTGDTLYLTVVGNSFSDIEFVWDTPEGRKVEVYGSSNSSKIKSAGKVEYERGESTEGTLNMNWGLPGDMWDPNFDFDDWCYYSREC